jgi:hypothetical protein
VACLSAPMPRRDVWVATRVLVWWLGSTPDPGAQVWIAGRIPASGAPAPPLPSLHLPKQMSKRAADGEFFGAIF